MQLINFIHQIATTLGDFFDLENGFLRYEMESFKQGSKIRGAGQRRDEAETFQYSAFTEAPICQPLHFAE